MFTFFTKKIYFADFLEGFVDIHNHILPGIDDGAKTSDESIALIKGFSELGVKCFICTPHIMHNYYDNTPETIKSAFLLLKEEMTRQGITDVAIDYAAEHMIDDNFENILELGKVLPLNERNILIEMSYLNPSINFDEAVKKILSKQLFPVFAHPERYAYLYKHFEEYYRYKKEGVRFQGNILSFFGYYGKEIQKVAFKILERGLYDFIASDVHNMRHLDQLKKEISISAKNLDNLHLLITNTISEFY